MIEAAAKLQTPGLRGLPSLAGMSQWLLALGHSEDDINALNVIHVAGTKGKGSTCAFTESFLRAYGSRTGKPRKSGLYTSPHLIVPEERIRINSQPLNRDLFAEYFFEVWDSVTETSNGSDDPSVLGWEAHGPRFLQLYALMALHVFVKEQVDVAILETHNGGEYDATNVVTCPVVTAVTSLGMDHVERLGPSIENIAWHKSGIYRRGAVALSTVQDAEPTTVLRERAAEVGQDLTLVREDTRLPSDAWPLRVEVQRRNASLALAAAEAWLGRQLSSKDIELGIQQWSWPGRFQIVRRPRSTWFLDAAHNEMSVRAAVEWFSNASNQAAGSSQPIRILVFSHISEERDPLALLGALAEFLSRSKVHVSHIIFSTYEVSEEDKHRTKAVDPTLPHEVWKSHFTDSRIWDEPTIQGACKLVDRLSYDSASGKCHVLVTGSQHLVGPALRYLQNDEY